MLMQAQWGIAGLPGALLNLALALPASLALAAGLHVVQTRYWMLSS